MEYKMKKSMALGVVIMLCAVAMIGAGYAAFSGNARTYNEGNSATSGAIVLANDGFTAMFAAANTEFDVYNAETATCYYFESGVTTEKFAISTTNYVGKALLTTEKKIEVTNNTGADISSLTFNTRTDKANVGNADFPYIIKVAIDGITGSEKYAILSTSATTDVPVIFTDFLPAEGTQAFADGAMITLTIQIYIAYSANYFVPNSGIGDVVETVPDGQGANYTAAKSSTAGPVDLDDVDFGFTVIDSTPVSP